MNSDRDTQSPGGRDAGARVHNLVSVDADDVTRAETLFAFQQVLGRVANRLSSDGCMAMIQALSKRPRNLETMHLFQAVDILNRGVEEAAIANNEPEAARAAHAWATTARIFAKTVWNSLDAGRDNPVPNIDAAVLVDFVDDAELMGILGLEAGRPPDVKRIDPDLDLKTSDPDGLS